MEQELTLDLFSTPEIILLFIVVGVIIAMYLLFVIAEWKILTKAGEKGYKSLIPIYNVFISHHIAGMSHIWFILEIITWTVEIILEIAEGGPEWLVIAFGIPTTIITVASALIHAIKLCNCFGKGTGFKIGMILIPSLFTMILAFGKAEYRNPNH